MLARRQATAARDDDDDDDARDRRLEELTRRMDRAPDVLRRTYDQLETTRGRGELLAEALGPVVAAWGEDVLLRAVLSRAIFACLLMSDRKSCVNFRVRSAPHPRASRASRLAHVEHNAGALGLLLTESDVREIGAAFT